MGKRLAAAWAAWKKKHWEPEHGVGFHADAQFISPGRTVYPWPRRLARWFAKWWAEKPMEFLTVIVGALGVLAAFIALARK